MASAQAIPPHDLDNTPNSSSIKIHSWRLTSTTLPISNASEITSAQDALGGLPLPEMTFGNNALILKEERSGWEYVFDAVGALRGVRLGEFQDGDGGVKVGYAKEWLKSRTDPSSQTPLSYTVAAKPFDWTYTATYSGHAAPNSPPQLEFRPADPSNLTHQIPLAQLTRPDPILFYSEITLFEDELHDNGSSTFSVRVRVMPTCLFLLARLLLRVDGVLFRMHDTRIYHDFSTSPPLVLKETGGWELPYNVVKRHLPSPDLSPLTDPQFVARVLTTSPVEKTQKEGAQTGWRGLGSTYEVLELSVEGQSEES